MSSIACLIEGSQVHPQWQPILEQALDRVDPDYLTSLLQQDDWLPGCEQLLAAFQRDRINMRYLLIGESPYPRKASANGIAFYDAAVVELWSKKGLSSAVNRATSLRNIVKTALLAEGLLQPDADGKLTQSAIAELDKTGLIETLPALFKNFEAAGFLMLNATPVLHPARKPVAEARYWSEFLNHLLELTAAQTGQQLSLLLWGKIATLIGAMPASCRYNQITCEHPYNLSFIDNPQMRRLFAELHVLQNRD